MHGLSFQSRPGLGVKVGGGFCHGIAALEIEHQGKIFSRPAKTNRVFKEGFLLGPSPCLCRPLPSIMFYFEIRLLFFLHLPFFSLVWLSLQEIGS